MDLNGALHALRERFRDEHGSEPDDGIAFAVYDPRPEAEQRITLRRITGVKVEDDEVLLVLAPRDEAATTAPPHMRLLDLLARLSALPSACAAFTVEALDEEVWEDDIRLRFDIPIHGVGRNAGAGLCVFFFSEGDRPDD